MKTAARISSEVALILACARVSLDAEGKERIKALLQRDLDWEFILRVAERHRVTALLFLNLTRANLEAIPPHILNRLANRVCRATAGNLSKAAELLGILDPFAKQGIRGVSFKGPTLSACAYGGLQLREFNDLDIMVRRTDVPVACDILTRRGYRPPPDWSLLSPKMIFSLSSVNAYHFERVSEGFNVDLQWPTRIGFFPLRMNVLLERVEQKLLLGAEVTTFTPEALLLVLCVHATCHEWQKLALACDIAELLRSNPRLDWTWLLKESCASGCRRRVLLGLLLAKRLLGSSLPDIVAAEIQANPAVDSLATQVEEDLFCESRGAPSLWRSYAFTLRAMDGVLQRIRFCLRLGLSPGIADLRALRLPRALFPFYFLIRPLRLIMRHLLLGSADRTGPYVPTPPEVVRKMLDMAKVGPNDVVYDLGSGDGRIVIVAAEKYGAKAVGVEFDEGRFKESSARLLELGLEKCGKIVRGNLFKTDVRPASVVTLYLLPDFNQRLRPRLEKELRPGTRLVSHNYSMDTWKAEQEETVVLADGDSHRVFLYVMPQPAPAASNK
jgi:hypothetical protein